MLNMQHRLAARLKSLRTEAQLSLAQLAEKSAVSRATLSRLEQAEVSPTAEVLGKLCAVYKMPMSHLMAMVEDHFTPYWPDQSQEVWHDPSSGFERRVVSPSAPSLKAELLRCRLKPGQSIAYNQPALQGLEHHLYMLEGELQLRVDDVNYHLKAGDCLRYHLVKSTIFSTQQGQGASYLMVLI